MVVSVQNADGHVDFSQAAKAVEKFFRQNDYSGRRVLLLIPDNTRSGPIGEIFQMIFGCLSGKANAIDALVALGTHQPLSEEDICRRLSISIDQRRSTYKSVKFFNHQWDKPETFAKIGTITAEEIAQISDGLFRENVDVSVNRLIFDYDEILILGPIFPHEVVGFSGGHKYLFPGIAAAELIDFFHWLGAVITNPQVNGTKWTPPRKVIEKAASFISVPRKLFGIVALHNELKGLFIGDVVQAWEQAADLSEQVHIVHVDKPYKTVLGIAAGMYDDIWTAGKVMYKLESIVADGGTLIIYAPHISEVSYTHGHLIDRIGYHTRDYFLNRMDDFAGIGRGVIAHSTHVKGVGKFENGMEKPRINVVLATAIPEERCRNINLGYLNPGQINIDEYENKDHQGTLVVHQAGEVLHKLKSGYVPDNDLRNTSDR